MSYKVALCTLGCRVNQYESQAVEELFIEKGFSVCDFSDKADIYIINTCAVTVESERKSRQMIRRARGKNESAVIGVIGCCSQLQPQKCAEASADIILGTSDKLRIVPLCIDALNGKIKTPYIDTATSTLPYCDSYTLNHSKRAREFIKIEDGCDGKCAYCTIAAARGKPRSKTPHDVVSEITKLVSLGCREVTLTGIELSSYEYGLCDLIHKVNEIDALYGIRLGSLEPTLINAEFLKTVSECEKLLPHFHISLQSGCTQTLCRMRRRYNAKTAFDNIFALKELNPRITFSCDLIVGFPAETDEEFTETLNFLEKIGFLHIHAFPYSKRPETPAYSMQNQVSGEVKNSRMKQIEALQSTVKNKILDNAMNEDTITALIESRKNGIYSAHTDNFIEIEVESDTDITSQIVNVRPVSHNGDILRCEIIK